MALTCHQHYYMTTLPGRQWPKIDAFITWLREQAKPFTQSETATR